MLVLFIRPMLGLTVDEAHRNCILFKVQHQSRNQSEDEEDTNETLTYGLRAGRIERHKLLADIGIQAGFTLSILGNGVNVFADQAASGTGKGLRVTNWR